MISDEEVITKWNIVRKLKHEGKLNQAADLLLEIANSSDDRIHKSAAFAGIGNIYRRQGRYNDANNMYHHGMSAWYKCPYSRMGLVNLLMNQRGSERNDGRAFKLLKEIDDAPVAGVHIMLGLMLMRGTGCSVDLEGARKEFLKGYRCGNLISLRLVTHVFWRQRKYIRAIFLEIWVLLRILPIYIKDKNDPRIRIN